MRRWIRVFFFIGAISAAVWFCATVKLGPRTAFEHAKQYRSVRIATAWLTARYDALFTKQPSTVQRGVSARSAANGAPTKTALEPAATAKRVAILENAAKEVAAPPRAREGAAAPKTRIDERFSKRHRKSLDDLVTSRVTRP